jgi:hypothetical protein
MKKILIFLQIRIFKMHLKFNTDLILCVWSFKIFNLSFVCCPRRFLTHIAAYHHLSLKFDQSVEPYDCKYLICLVLAKHSKLKSADWLYDYFLRALRLTQIRYWIQWRFRTYSLFTCSQHYWKQTSLSSGTSKKSGKGQYSCLLISKVFSERSLTDV